MQLTKGRIIFLSLCAAVLLAWVVGIGNFVVAVSTGDVVVIQYLNGTLEVFDKPGLVCPWFGKVTVYKPCSLKYPCHTAATFVTP